MNNNKMNNFNYIDIRKLDESQIGKNIWISGRVHRIRKKGKMCFIVLRYQDYSIQCLARKGDCGTDEEFTNLCKLSTESIINLYGELVKPPKDIEATTYKTFELYTKGYTIISTSHQVPFEIDNANDYGNDRNDIGQVLRLNKRWLDLRAPVNMSIMKIQSKITQLFREFLNKNDFIEIHSPKIIGSSSEGGAEVFKINYFNENNDKNNYNACLAQSPQLYKQMAINADFDRVFEIGPVFRAEKHNTNRHLCEYTGLDLEMTISPNKNYYEILDFIWQLLVNMFYTLKNDKMIKKYCEIIREKLPFKDPIYPNKPLIISFSDGVKMLKEAGYKQEELEDLSTENEYSLGKLIKKKYGSDLFVLDKYPANARPFYTMPCDKDSNYSCSYDIIFRGKEISSGAQRVNNYEMLIDKIKDHGIDPKTLESYTESFAHGSRPHGGCGLGLERLTMIYLDLNNIRKTSFCPRDPNRLYP